MSWLYGAESEVEGDWRGDHPGSINSILSNYCCAVNEREAAIGHSKTAFTGVGVDPSAGDFDGVNISKTFSTIIDEIFSKLSNIEDHYNFPGGHFTQAGSMRWQCWDYLDYLRRYITEFRYVGGGTYVSTRGYYVRRYQRRYRSGLHDYSYTYSDDDVVNDWWQSSTDIAFTVVDGLRGRAVIWGNLQGNEAYEYHDPGINRIVGESKTTSDITVSWNGSSCIVPSGSYGLVSYGTVTGSYVTTDLTWPPIAPDVQLNHELMSMAHWWEERLGIGWPPWYLFNDYDYIMSGNWVPPSIYSNAIRAGLEFDVWGTVGGATDLDPTFTYRALTIT